MYWYRLLCTILTPTPTTSKPACNCGSGMALQAAGRPRTLHAYSLAANYCRHQHASRLPTSMDSRGSRLRRGLQLVLYSCLLLLPPSGTDRSARGCASLTGLLLLLLAVLNWPDVPACTICCWSCWLACFCTVCAPVNEVVLSHHVVFGLLLLLPAHAEATGVSNSHLPDHKRARHQTINYPKVLWATV
jgi:hypothetical protein